jgi:Protein of unknown function (DUF3800)
MKVCYVDESGNQPTDPCLIMVGLLVDAVRLNRTREEFDDIFEMVSGHFDEELRELKGSKILFGRDRWRKIDPSIRKSVTERMCSWLSERKHHLVLSAIDKAKFEKQKNASLPEFTNDPWLSAAVHVALQLQKNNQGKSHNKGLTFLVFDENKAKADILADLLWDVPRWTDDYYTKKSKQERLDQLIDSAFTVKSHHAGLVQIADLYAFILRRFVEFCDFGVPEEWSGEKQLINGYVDLLRSRLLPQATRLDGLLKPGAKPQNGSTNLRHNL